VTGPKTRERRVPPGCCPGCFLEVGESEPCPLHRAGADLLAALRGVVESCPCARHVGTDRECDPCRAGRAAIAKAGA
jgi:hypothetical protein